ncbi:MAG: Dihydropteroate synthase [Syntrophus sp. PtaU1.Bin005]|jgi:dihydropteroate synthase|uniref:dihydropteroate synthase n=1 Tax=Syntrophus TaxID=43773 RepID=UPI0009D5149F|nr:MAG: Dihydropteroate synthase [Syntrophus sp. PtaB.Bin138]OPY83506.1 MAG: Dihydropteroate synthase [Syntrophus sp. PtaU1.Bin005]
MGKAQEAKRFRHPLRSLSGFSPSELAALMQSMGVDPYGIDAMLPKMRHLNILIEGLECKVANILKQEMLSVGGDAAVSRQSVSCAVERTDAILMGTEKQLRRLAEKISCQPFGLRAISGRLKDLLAREALEWISLKTAKRELVFGGKTHIMGILNVTPDSFSDGGKYLPHDLAVAHGVQLAEAGADILDIGGESSRPGAEAISLKEEAERILPVIKKLAQEIDIPISIDTTKSEIAREALAAGAEIINDISAMTFDEAMSEAVRDSGAAIVLMHMRGKPKDMQLGDLTYRSVQGDVFAYLEERIDQAVSEGLRKEQMIIDPGLGFGKTPADSLKLLKHLREFRALGRPILVGPSKKRFVALGSGGPEFLSDPQQRLEGTAAAVAAAIMNGAHIVRVHDVPAMKKVAAMTDALLSA